MQRLFSVHAARRCPHVAARAARCGPVRCSPLSTAAPSAWAILDLTPGSPPQQIKARFYELAKKTHPDVATDGDDSDAHASFIEILAAFEELMSEGEAGSARAGSSTSPSAAARGGAAQSSRRRSGGAAGGPVERERSLGDILCERLEEEPHAAREVWADIVEQRLHVRETMLEALFRACGAKGGGGLSTALEILRDAQELGLLTKSTREAAAISIIKCKSLPRAATKETLTRGARCDARAHRVQGGLDQLQPHHQ